MSTSPKTIARVAAKSQIRATPRPAAGPATDSRSSLLESEAKELIFAVVGHVGSGTSTVAQNLKNLLEVPGPKAYDVGILKARDVIVDWALKQGHEVPPATKRDLEAVRRLQDLGDLMRSEGDHAAVAKGIVRNIQLLRAQKTGFEGPVTGPVPPDGQRRAYIVDSIRHPAEIQLLRHIYQDAFIVIGVVCEEQRRLDRVVRKYEDAGVERAKRFMKRDEKATEKHGQRVSDAFHLSDFFLDNTVERLDAQGAPREDWDILQKLKRLIKIIDYSEIVRPEIGETAMHHAYAAAMQSACLSRQVGAALVDAAGNIVSTGTNEVPQAGGGVYGEDFNPDDKHDHRCAFRQTGSTAYCSNTTEQIKIVEDLINDIPELNVLDPIRRNALKAEIRRGRVGDILEFSRAVHAEMDAVLSAGRSGTVSVERKDAIKNFVVPIRIDDLAFDEVRANLARKNIVDFKSNWASGLAQLLKSFERDRVPKTNIDGSVAFSRWLEKNVSPPALLSATPELLISNWLPITGFPKDIVLHEINADSRNLTKLTTGLPFPTFRYLRLVGGFCSAEDLQPVGVEQALFKENYRIPLHDFLEGRPTDLPGLERRDAQNFVSSLLRQSWDNFAIKRGLTRFETASGSAAWFVAKDLIDQDQATFVDTAGKVRKRKLVGRSEKRAVYWHYGVEMRPALGRLPHFSLRAHVVFTEDGRRLIPSKERMHSLRRSFCRSWWNDRWRDLLQAFTNWLSSGDETVALPTGSEGLSILLETKPSSMISPFSLVEHSVEELPDDVADAMDWDTGEDDIDLGELDLADEAST